MRHVLFLFAIILAAYTGHAQQWNEMNPRELVIIQSTKNYGAALNTARDAAKRLGYPLDLGGNKPHKTAGLSMSREDCEGSAWDYPCYTPRGNGGPAEEPRFVSIEWSSGYEGFTPGYYIVVVADGVPGSPDSRGALSQARKVYKAAYAKTTKVWYGCMH